MAASRTIEELDAIAEDFIDAKKKQHDIWNEEEEAYYQLYLQEQDMEIQQESLEQEEWIHFLILTTMIRL